MKKIFWWTFLFIAILVSFSFISHADDQFQDNKKNNCDIQENSSCSNELSTIIYFQSEKKHFGVDEIIYASYSTTTDISIVSFSYVQYGFNVVDVSVDEQKKNEINIHLLCLQETSEASITIEVTLSNLEEKIFNLYAIKNEYGVFISPSSIEHAKRVFEKYAIREGIIQEKTIYTIEEWIALKSNYANNTIDFFNNTNTYVTSSISTKKFNGNLTWIDDSGNSHALRKVTIGIYAESLDGFILLGTAISADDGSYSIDKPNISNIWFESDSINLLYKIYASDGNVVVKDSFEEGEVYAFEQNGVASFTDWELSDIEADISVPMKIGDAVILEGRALQVYQAVVTARDYAYEMMGEKPENVTFTMSLTKIIYVNMMSRVSQ